MQNIKNTIEIYLRDYKQFIGVESFPEYELQTHAVSLAKADKQGYESAASTYYNASSDKHTLVVSTNLLLSKYLICHEFTHILDTELYAKRDKVSYMGLSGYTEYHASQVELMILLNAKSINEDISFSMNDTIDTFAGKKTVQEYITMKYQHAVDLFGRPDFPSDIANLKTALGVWYNYLGLRSICEKHAVDYKTCEDNNRVIMKFIPSQLFTAINTIMHGWLDESMIKQISIPLYVNTIMPIIKDYQLA